MKTVFSSAEEVANAWAADSQPEGRTSNRKVRFSNGAIRSYGYAMGVLFRAPDGSRFALIEALHPSNTTAAQISLSRAAAEKVGATIVQIADIDQFEGMYSKVAKRHLGELRKRLETDIETRIAEAERYEPVSWAQAHRLEVIAKKIEMHQAVARAFGLDWPPQASQKAFAARGRASYKAAFRKTEIERNRMGEARDRRFEAIQRERQERIDPAREVQLWLRGERVSLQHQPGQFLRQRVRFRIAGRKAETSDNRSLPFSEFARMFRSAVAIVANPAELNPGDHHFQFGRKTYRLDQGGDFHCTYGGRDVIYFDDLMACVEVGAPRLFAQAQRMLHPEPAGVAVP